MFAAKRKMLQGRRKKWLVKLQSEQVLAGRNKMRLPTKSGFAMATIVAASFGFAGLTQAAPLAGVAAAVPAVQITQAPSAAEALPEKAYHGYKHHYGYKKPCHHHVYHHHHIYHHHHVSHHRYGKHY
jgi:hypothetical protein